MAAGDKTLWADIDLLVNRRRCRLVATATQSIPHNVATALTFTSEEYDVYGFHDPVTNNSRITPNVAGWYTVRGAVHFPARADWTMIQCYYRKNGAGGTSIASGDRQGTTGNVAQSRSPQAALIDFNGTTDYVELITQHTNTAAVAQVTNQSAFLSSIFEVIYEGPL